MPTHHTRTMFEDLLAENARLRAENEEIRIQRDAAEAHAVFAHRRHAVAQHQLNKKIERSNNANRRLHTKSRVVTTDAGRAEIAAIRAEQLEREQRNDERQRKKAEAAAATLTRRITQGENVEFSGTVHGRNKEGLQDIAYALGLPLEGMKKTLVDSIKAHLDMHQESLSTDRRFAGLYLSRARGQKRSRPADDESQPIEAANIRPCPRPRRCLEGDVSNLPSLVQL